MNLPKIFLLATLLIAISACGGRPAAEIPKNPETPAALQDNAQSFSLKRSYENDLVNSIYMELLKKRPDLQKLENAISASTEGQADSLRKYRRFLSRSDEYYSAAEKTVRSITDTLLKKKMKEVIAASKVQNDIRQKLITELLNNVSKNDTVLNNYHQALKVMVSLPVIERYQKDEYPDLKTLRQTIAEKQKLIEQTKVLLQKR